MSNWTDFLEPIRTDEFDGGVVIDGLVLAPFWFDGSFKVNEWGNVVGIHQVTPHGRIKVTRDKPLFNALRVAFERDYCLAIQEELDAARKRARDDHADVMRGEVRL